MQALLDVILPVFLVIGAGYLAVWKGWFSQTHVDGLMRFAQNFAFPFLLFRALSTVDLGQTFDWRVLVSYYTGSVVVYLAGYLGARVLFKRDVEDSVAIGFVALFANSLMLGLTITERAFGADALGSNYAIIALHSPICYGIGITSMEIARARASGSPARALPARVLKAMFSNTLVLGIVCGFLFNLSGLTLPTFIGDGLDLMVRAALPVALFGMGGILVQYRPEGDLRAILYVVSLSLILHPMVAWGMGRAMGISTEAFRSVVLTASMAPGINAYIFANMYGRARRVAASGVLIATALSIVTASVWLSLLP